MAQLHGIAIRRASREPMQVLESIEVTKEAGITGDFRGKPGKRQVTVLSLDAWNYACNHVGADLHWTTRRANLCVSGIHFDESSVDCIIEIGTVRLQITKETVPCYRMDEYCDGLQKALVDHWRGGVCCKVLSNGLISVGDEVRILDDSIALEILAH